MKEVGFFQIRTAAFTNCTAYTEWCGKERTAELFSLATDSKIRRKANSQSRRPNSNGCGPLK